MARKPRTDPAPPRARTAAAAAANKRRQIRFHPDENALVECRFEDIRVHKIGLLYEESSGGCSGVFLTDREFRVDRLVSIVPGKLARMAAEIKWVREFHPRVVRVGFRYLE